MDQATYSYPARSPIPISSWSCPCNKNNNNHDNILNKKGPSDDRQDGGPPLAGWPTLDGPWWWSSWLVEIIMMVIINMIGGLRR